MRGTKCPHLVEWGRSLMHIGSIPAFFHEFRSLFHTLLLPPSFFILLSFLFDCMVRPASTLVSGSIVPPPILPLYN